MDVKKQLFKAALFKKEYNLGKLLAEKYYNAQDKIQVVNVVGTNGKGSVSNYLQRQLMLNYKKVGLFTSPAFLKHNERIKINNQFIGDNDLKRIIKSIKDDIKTYQLTFFEIWVLICIKYFLEQQIKVAVIEAGIGGRLDATNVFNNQLALLLTSIDYDHTEVLGTRLESIIQNKVGIVKNDCQLFISASCQKYFSVIAKYLNSDRIITSEVYPQAINYYQEFNVGLVIKFLTVFKFKINYALLKVNPVLGRFTQLSKNPYFIIDGAHNPEGIRACIHTFEMLNNLNHDEVLVLYASSQKKDYLQNLMLLKEHFGSNLYITTFKHPMSWDITDINFHNKVKNWKKLLLQNKTKNILICGSLYFIPLVYQFYLERM
ncbi:bifunctional folylpolyglutamate synthase/dihydrofolate synthase [Spiroplasma endosymbiont of Phyllotreta cruciferae]|uniref:bifunctional folylpolyglutamate synthase/dihydrofolate synthase n=1 Tax=Spiroplasma endosymbiont of Phyllotreta cruciferae TaxID=2886375 RepID=UPI0020A10D2E|nr:bifunctional folylpolyglutamate synthase/dihydrofolate synthase [Spiroplasma endosymbiont of Phyllotreta cruciferae]